MRSRLLAAAFVLALALAVAVTSATPATGFTPKLLAGKWTGTWTNETFGSSGTVSATVKAPNNKRLVVSLDLGGTVFGCSDPDPVPVSLVQGQGANRWNAAGFRIQRSSAALGRTTFVYNHAKKTLKASGSDPACAPGLSWKVDGKFAGKTFSGTVAITLPGGQTAVSKIEATKA